MNKEAASKLRKLVKTLERKPYTAPVATPEVAPESTEELNTQESNTNPVAYLKGYLHKQAVDRTKAHKAIKDSVEKYYKDKGSNITVGDIKDIPEESVPKPTQSRVTTPEDIADDRRRLNVPYGTPYDKLHLPPYPAGEPVKFNVPSKYMPEIGGPLHRQVQRTLDKDWKEYDDQDLALSKGPVDYTKKLSQLLRRKDPDLVKEARNVPVDEKASLDISNMRNIVQGYANRKLQPEQEAILEDTKGLLDAESTEPIAGKGGYKGPLAASYPVIGAGIGAGLGALVDTDDMPIVGGAVGAGAGLLGMAVHVAILKNKMNQRDVRLKNIQRKLDLLKHT